MNIQLAEAKARGFVPPVKKVEKSAEEIARRKSGKGEENSR